MSLLHQVLQDIDQRQPAPAALPDAFLVSNPAPRRLIWWLVPLLLVLVAVVIWFIWPMPETAQATPAIAEPSASVSKPSPAGQTETSIPVVAAATTPAATSPTTARATTPATKPATVVVTPAAAVTTQNSVSPTPSVRASEAVRIKQEQASETPSLAISRVGDPARDDYLAALDALKNNQTGTALAAINRALLLQEKPSYLSLKLRILLEQKNSKDFLDFYNQHAQEESVSWLAVAAPGLHMLGYPQLAVGPYQQLIVLQPGVVNWPLALSAAWEEQNKPVPARAVLQNVLQHYRLSAEQQQWVQRRIEVLGG